MINTNTGDNINLSEPKRSGKIHDKELASMLRIIVPDGLRSVKIEHLDSIVEEADSYAEDMAAWLIENKPEWENDIIAAFHLFIWSNRYWRLNNLYYIKVKESDDKDIESSLKMKFKMNAVQEELFFNMHNKNIILKARQLGVTTFWQILIIDYILFTPNIGTGVIAQTRDDGSAIFKDKIQYAYDNLPQEIRDIRTIKKADVNELIINFEGMEGSNTSKVKVAVSLRSGTYQIVHISELAKICKESPAKADEIKSGTFPTVPESGIIAIESTAEGNTGLFKDICDEAQKSMAACKRDGRELHPKEWKFFFFPWFIDKSYQTNPRGVEIKTHIKDYFRALMEDPYIKENYDQSIFTPERVAWYQLEEAQQGDKMKQEYPSTPKEAFEQAVEGTYFEKEMLETDKQLRIGKFPYDPSLPVYTSWDIGFSDYTTICFFQIEGLQIRIIHYYEECNKAMMHYINYINAMQWSANYGNHYAPHDIMQSEWTSGQTKRLTALQNGIEFTPVDKCENKHDEIEEARRRFPMIHFNADSTEKLRTHLQLYRRKWDKLTGTWRDKPVHDMHSHGTDSFLILCRAIDIIRQGGNRVSEVQPVVGQVSNANYEW